MKPIRVLEIISGFAVEGPLGGIERFGIELAQTLDQSKIAPIVCGMWAYDTAYEYEWVRYLQQRGVPAFIAADWHEESPIVSFRNALQQTPNYVDQVDIIHSHCQFGDVLALLLKRKLKAKTLVRTIHNEKEWGKRPFRRYLLTNGIYPLMFDRELGVAQQVVDNLDKRPFARILNRQAIKSYNALNLERFAAAQLDINQKKAELGFPKTAQIVGSIGRLTEQKGYRYLLDAAKILLNQNQNIRILIVGDGNLDTELKEHAAQLGISEYVLFTGARSDVESLLSIMDLFVNSSLWEGLPTVIMESMAARVPVVATDVGGNKELVKQNNTGWLVPCKDADELAKRINLVLQADPEQIKLICENAYKHVRDKFSITAIARQYEQIYDQLLQNS